MQSKYYGWGLPIDISKQGAQIDQLIGILHVFMLLLFISWSVFFVYVLIRFRKRTGYHAEHHTQHFKTPTVLEAGIAVTEFVILFAFAIPIWHTVKNQLPPRDKSVQLRVVAEQFAWNIHYPGKDDIYGKSDMKLVSASNPLGMDPNDPNGKDDIITLNQLHIPVDTPVIVDLSSKDVIHSFSVPVMRVKQDVIPGQVVPVWFEAKQTGHFEIACAQLCGLGHYRMRGFFIVDSKEDFKKWIEGQSAEKAKQA